MIRDKAVDPNLPRDRLPRWARTVVLLVLSAVFVFLLIPSEHVGVLRIGTWNVTHREVAALVALAPIGWLLSGSLWGAFILSSGGLLLLVAVRLLAMGTLAPHILWLLAGAVVGSGIGGFTYVCISVVNAWSDIHEDRQAEVERSYIQLKVEWDHFDDKQSKLQQALVTTRSQQSREQIEKKLNELSDRFKSLGEELKRNRLEYHREPEWREVKSTISWWWRLMRIPMAMGIAAGMALLGSLLGIDPLKEAKQENLPTILGVFFLVGLYPRVFESFLKELADRITGEKEEAVRATRAQKSEDLD